MKKIGTGVGFLQRIWDVSCLQVFQQCFKLNCHCYCDRLDKSFSKASVLIFITDSALNWT